MKLHAMLCTILVLGVVGCSYFDKPAVVDEPMPTSAELRESQGQAAMNVPGVYLPQAVTGQYADITRRTSKGSVEIYSLDGNGFESDKTVQNAGSYAPPSTPALIEPEPYHFSAEDEMERARRASVMQDVEK